MRFSLPTLRVGDVVLLGDLSSHNGADLAKHIRAAGADVDYLPPDSPDLIPIEMAFGKVKKRRSAAPRCPYHA